MAENVLGALFSNIANAIREKTGNTATMKPAEFPAKILDIETSRSYLPIEISTEAEMTDALDMAEIGSIYKYTGETTDTYENGTYYVVELEEEVS